MASEADTESEFNPDTLLADLEPLEDLDDAEFGLPPVENPPSLEDILAGNDEDNDEFEDGVDLDDVQFEPMSCEPISLSTRELEVITLIAEGSTNTQIASKLFLSNHTVNTHRKNIMRKLGVNNTAGIVMYAVKSQLVSPNKFLFASSNS